MTVISLDEAAQCPGLRGDAMSNPRRRILVGAMGIGAASAVGCRSNQPRADPPRQGDRPRQPANLGAAPMPMRKLGKTGGMVSAVGIGGFHLGSQADESESNGIIRSALDRGVTCLH